MSVAIENEAFDNGLSIVLQQLDQAINNYEDYLTTFGTCPSMELVDKLREIEKLILTHDRKEELRPFNKLRCFKIEEEEE